MADKVTYTAEQQEAISEIDRNLQIIACAGSGKTEVITQRIANILRKKPDVHPGNIVAFTFTEKAADSLRRRIEKALENDGVYDLDEMYIGTIHGYCRKLLTECSDEFEHYQILDTVKNYLFVKRYHNHCGMENLALEPFTQNVKLFLQCIDKMIDDYDNADAWSQTQRTALDQYIDCLYGHNSIDFTLLIFEALQQILNNPTAADNLKKIRYLVVDEYQDVDDMQERLIRLISKAGANVCVVGDDDQTIYQFRGSNAENMISFAENYSDVHQVWLEKNFRCSKGIVDVADHVIRHNVRRLPKKMYAADDSDASLNGTEIKMNRWTTKEEQYHSIALKIKAIHQSGVPYREMAILVRKGKFIVPASAALDQESIPYETDSAEHFFKGEYYNRFVETLKILNDMDRIKLCECWQDMLDNKQINDGFYYLRSQVGDGRKHLSEILRGFCEKIRFLDEHLPDIDDRTTDLEGMAKILDDYDDIYGDWQLTKRVDGVIYFLERHAAEEYKYHSFKPKDPDSDAVQIMTVHKAKGLEFHTVFLPELTARDFPSMNRGGRSYWHVLGGCFEENKSRYQSDLEDERKLFYVALTRAKKNLFLSYSRDKSASCFVEEAAESDYLVTDRIPVNMTSVTEKAPQKVSQPRRQERKRRLDTDKSHSFSTEESLNKQDIHTISETRTQIEPSREPVSTEIVDTVSADVVKNAKRMLFDHYGTLCQVKPEAMAELRKLASMSPEAIIAEAKKLGLM